MFESTNIAHNKIPFYKNLIRDYINQEEKIKDLYGRDLSIEAFKYQMDDKQKNYNFDRTILVEELTRTYVKNKTKISFKIKQNLSSLLKDNTFTITTGHQLNLFTGPSYFIYKILQAIKTTEVLKKAYPNNDFVPIYWMASEDHDFEEISTFNLFNHKFTWKSDQRGAVGKFKIETEWIDHIEKKLSGHILENKLLQTIIGFYKNSVTLSEAHFKIVNYLFDDYGLVIVEADNKALKQAMIPYFSDELTKQLNQKAVEEVNTKILSNGGHVQVSPREINLFYLTHNSRERIVLKENTYTVLNTKIRWTKEEIIQELKNNPERFSPNVILRPLYQEVILPNLEYIGGAGEIAYWLQLSGVFIENKVTMPILAVRNSFVITKTGVIKKMDKFDIRLEDIFLTKDKLIRKYATKQIEVNILEQEKENLNVIFNRIQDKLGNIDHNLIQSTAAEQTRALKSLKRLNKKLIRSIKKQKETEIKQIEAIKDAIYPRGNFQERTINFLEFIINGEVEFLEKIFAQIEPLNSGNIKIVK